MHPSARRIIPTAAALAATALLAAPGTSPARAAAAGSTCHGLPVTVSAHAGVVDGTPGPDVIRLTGPGVVRSGAGADVVCGSGGADTIQAGPGADVVLAGAGADTVDGGAGRDNVFAEAGDDLVTGGPGRDVVVGGAGADLVTAAAGDAVGAGPYAISLYMQAQDLQQFYATGTSVGLAQGPAQPVPGQATVLWSSFSPLTANSIVWQAQPFQLYSAQAPLEPGVNVVMQSVVPAAAGSAWLLAQPGQLTQTGGGAPGGGVQVTAGPGAGFGTVVGLGQAPVVNGGTNGVAPFTAVSVPGPDLTVTIPPPATVSVFPVQFGQAGTVLGSLPPGAATVTPGPSRPTATFVYSAARGGFVATG